MLQETDKNINIDIAAKRRKIRKIDGFVKNPNFVTPPLIGARDDDQAGVQKLMK
jgi:hypothetical protein